MWLSSTPDPTDPLLVRVGTFPPAPPMSASLAQIAAQMNARAADGLKVSVEPYLAPKRATVFGEEAATPRQALDALAEVYGLRVLDRGKGSRATTGLRLNSADGACSAELHCPARLHLPGPARPARPRLSKHSASAVYDPKSSLLPVFRRSKCMRCGSYERGRNQSSRRLKTGAWPYPASPSRKAERLRTLVHVRRDADLLSSLDNSAIYPLKLTRLQRFRWAEGLYEEEGKKRLTFALQFP